VNTLKHTWMTAAYLCAAIIGFATASASSKDTAAPAEHKPEENKPVEHQVDIKNFLYNPDPIRVKPGDTITGAGTGFSGLPLPLPREYAWGN